MHTREFACEPAQEIGHVQRHDELLDARMDDLQVRESEIKLEAAKSLAYNGCFAIAPRSFLIIRPS